MHFQHHTAGANPMRVWYRMELSPPGDGLPVEKVAQYTGLSIEDIQALETEPVTV